MSVHIVHQSDTYLVLEETPNGVPLHCFLQPYQQYYRVWKDHTTTALLGCQLTARGIEQQHREQAHFVNGVATRYGICRDNVLQMIDNVFVHNLYKIDQFVHVEAPWLATYASLANLSRARIIIPIPALDAGFVIVTTISGLPICATVNAYLHE